MAAEEYKDYLAARVLAEHKPVTYRLLSRALHTNVQTARRMLFEFHKRQNAKKPNSVHATYLVTGTPRRAEQTIDTDMRSPPFMSSMSEPEAPKDSDLDHTSESDSEGTIVPSGVRETEIILVREEELEETRAQFEGELSVHIYSLEPGPLEDLGVLSACNHEIGANRADEDPLERWKLYGSIRNQHIKRRTGKWTGPVVTSTSKSASTPAVTSFAKLGAKEKGASAPASRGGASEDSTSGRSTPQLSAAPSTLKRTDSKSGKNKDRTAGDIFKSFAKAKAKPQEADKSKGSTPAPVADEPMQGMSEDEGDADDEPEIKIDEEKNAAAQKARQERAERLRKMMEDDDEEMPDAPAADSQPEASPAAAGDTPEPTEGEATVTAANGRRRGRRRVMKKKKVKDEDGYLVTKEEVVWESFSEDEPAPKKAKAAPAKPASSVKGKTGGKKGQGSIASFFKKA
ncbi:hypothetical protein BDW02DRAFT_593872 [Decorospora gaudefroyi]|uniref:DNA polymerase delta subunit 3 n=1 Tax=Decorospora gaudefroyi TaxID=184978 RepID=A0A6A5KTD7_9PLEO|nr:hypothetical protein BDW02DRAFT_593872 [Decorospora gaudefroyi]